MTTARLNLLWTYFFTVAVKVGGGIGSSDCFLKGAVSPACPSPTEPVQKYLPCPGSQYWEGC